MSPGVASVASTLRSVGSSVDVVLEDRKMKWVFKHADRIGAKKVVVVGGEEEERGCVSVKDMDSGEQREIKIEDLGK